MNAIVGDARCAVAKWKREAPEFDDEALLAVANIPRVSERSIDDRSETRLRCGGRLEAGLGPGRETLPVVRPAGVSLDPPFPWT